MDFVDRVKKGIHLGVIPTLPTLLNLLSKFHFFFGTRSFVFLHINWQGSQVERILVFIPQTLPHCPWGLEGHNSASLYIENHHSKSHRASSPSKSRIKSGGGYVAGFSVYLNLP